MALTMCGNTWILSLFMLTTYGLAAAPGLPVEKASVNSASL